MIKRALAAGGLAAITLSGCAQVVSGHASAAQDFPSSTSSPPTELPGVGVTVSYAAGHFRARFPARPEEGTQTGDLGGVHFIVHIAVVHQIPPSEVACEDTSESVPVDQRQLTLRTATGAFAASSQMSVVTQQPTTFRAHEAQSATLTGPDGGTYSLLVFFWSSTRLYIIFGPEGAVSDTLRSSFAALP